jgi:hypothetical protein
MEVLKQPPSNRKKGGVRFCSLFWYYFLLLHVIFVFVNFFAISMDNLEEDYKAFLLPAPECTNCIKQVLMLKLSKTDH